MSPRAAAPARQFDHQSGQPVEIEGARIYHEIVGQESCKVLIARGEDDHLTPSDAVRRLARRIPDSRLLTIPDAGHVAFQDQPELFLRSLLDFLG
ncbi:alpha/beta fold hydrolase [Sorangium sp. So ce1182]|uniref:alpha/beta fold hydrolase n=1 Tax=Sorangium sp. So ce1182 TaxID=3133334 RepID=UPI003F5F98FB